MNPGAPRPAPPPGAVARPANDPVVPPAAVPGQGLGDGSGQGSGRVPGSGHPAVDAALQGIANAAMLPPADQIAQYEAAHRTLRETLATIDQA